MKQTVLHQKHLQLKAKMTDFQGWQVPLQYTDVLDEYHAVRTAAGLFDISYLGRIEIAGQGATVLLQNIFSRNTAKMAAGSAHYGFICNESGHVLDDSVLFRLPEGQSGSRYILSTNALNTEKIVLWLKRHASPEAQISNVTETTAHLSLQGPQSFSILEKLSGTRLKKIKIRSMRALDILDTPVLASRTGYTGEHGYELFLPADRAGRRPGRPAQHLAARDARGRGRHRPGSRQTRPRHAGPAAAGHARGAPGGTGRDGGSERKRRRRPGRGR